MMQKKPLKEKNLIMTSSNNYIEEQLISLNISPEKQLDKLNHLTADYIELQALFHPDCVSLNDILEKYYKEEVKITTIKKSEEQLGLTDSEEKDQDEIWIKEMFQICINRSELLTVDYPFHLEETTIELKEDLSGKQKIYLLLLLASNLNYFPKFQSKLTTDFEAISYESLKNYLPREACIKQFGKNSDYNGTAKQKIKNLAVDLKIRCDEEMIEDNATGNQERGLDVIGWIPFKDEIPNLLTVFGQCACGKDWFKKQGETKRYEKYYRFVSHTPIHSMFIPYALVKDSSRFFQADEVDCLLFERFRILQNLRNTDFVDTLESKNIVDRCVAFG